MLPKNALTKMLVQEAITQLNAVFRTVKVFRTEMKRLAEQLPEYPIGDVPVWPWAILSGRNSWPKSAM